MKWQWWSQHAERWSEELRDEAREHIDTGINLRLIVLAVAAVVVAVVAMGVYWSREPAPFDVAASVNIVLHEPIDRPVAGAVTTATLTRIVAVMLDKPGGFINNDIAPPGVWLDDMPSWERGVLLQSRDMVRALRDDFGRTAVDAQPDDDLARAEPRLNFSEHSWMLPSSESQYRDARDYLRSYLSRLQNQDDSPVQFIASPANLDHYLERVTQRLDVIVQQLSACVAPSDNPLLQWSAADMPQRAISPSNKIDNVFYEARGSAWALLHLLRALDADFAGVLRERNARPALLEAIRALDATQDRIYSPVILNGSGFGLVANHSLVMASYMARADAAVATVRRLLLASAPESARASDVQAESMDSSMQNNVEKSKNSEEDAGVKVLMKTE